jgi:hypothetical protein
MIIAGGEIDVRAGAPIIDTARIGDAGVGDEAVDQREICRGRARIVGLAARVDEIDAGSARGGGAGTVPFGESPRNR